jgi:cell division protein FtsX
MNAYDSNLDEKQRGFDAIEARLEQHQRTTRIILIIVSILAALALILIVNYIPACATMAERLLSSIP